MIGVTPKITIIICLNFTAVAAAAAMTGRTEEGVFLSKNVDEHFFLHSLEAEIHSWGMNFVEEDVHDPGGEEGQPADGEHRPDPWSIFGNAFRKLDNFWIKNINCLDFSIFVFP